MNHLTIMPKDRFIILDILRGFALFGVLTVNIVGFATPAFIPGYTGPDTTFWLDQPMQNFLLLFFQGKFYTVLSFLFGLGFSIQLANATQKGQDISTYYRKRLLLLLLIGLIHSFLLWTGDILRLYAILGLIMLLFRSKSNLCLISWCLLFFIISYFSVLFLTFIEFNEATVLGINFLEMAKNAYQGSSYLNIFQFQVIASLLFFALIVLTQGFSVIALFLLGLLLGKLSIIQKIAGQYPIKYIFFLSLGIGLTLNILLLQENNRALFSLGFVLGMPTLALSYICGILLIWKSKFGRKLQPLAQLGRMTLTNYVLQSVVCLVLFSGIGLGLYQKVSLLGLFGIALIIYMSQIILSIFWLRHFRVGPLEWLWKTLSKQTSNTRE